MEDNVTTLKPDKIIPSWKRQTASSRLMECVDMLRLHGFMTYPESEPIQKRIFEWIKANKHEDQQ